MAEAPKPDALKVDQKIPRKPKLRYQDRPEIGETFADSIRSCIFDGQLVRIEFTVARFDDPGALGILEGRQVRCVVSFSIGRRWPISLTALVNLEPR